MVITTCQRAMTLFPPTWRHHHLMIASTTVPIIQWQLIFFLGVDQYTKANLRLGASLPPCTLRSPRRKRAHDRLRQPAIAEPIAIGRPITPRADAGCPRSLARLAAR